MPPKKTVKECNHKKNECIERNFECEWIVGKGCVPKSGAKLDFSAFPPDIKRLIASKLSAKNATVLKAVDKENKNLIASIKYTNDDYLEYALKPYVKKLLKSLKTYEKTFRKNIKNVSLQDIITDIKTSVFKDDPKLESAMSIMNKSPKAKEEINAAVISGIYYCNRLTLPPNVNQDIKDISTLSDLKKYITYNIAKDYQDSYLYATNH